LSRQKTGISDIVGSFWLIPIVLFLVAAGVFSAGYLPLRGEASLDLPAEIKKILKRAIKYRFLLGIVGFISVALGIVVGIGVLMSLSA
jgi:hypothetical protein